MAVSARWDATDFNTTTHRGMLTVLRMLLQLSPDGECGGGLAAEVLAVEPAPEQSASPVPVVLSQGSLLVLPAYAFSRVRHRSRSTTHVPPSAPQAFEVGPKSLGLLLIDIVLP
eukprot:SAG11_NODE_3399_length_2469_cov_4.036287_4_plen_114_part_00